MELSRDPGMQPNSENKRRIGTLAIDLGNSTTVIAFQAESDKHPKLLDIPPISRLKGEVPSLVWQSQGERADVLIGQQVLELGLSEKEKLNVCNDFKRWIGSTNPPLISSSKLLAEQAGEHLIQQIWEKLPPELSIKRLVLTAPIETFRAYRTWLYKVCRSLPVDEIALVDEPTAAAMGAAVPVGSKLLVVDIGGGTIDLSLVALEGGEGRAEPIAQLLRFAGEDLEGKSNQILRCAKVLGKAGQRLGGKDFDRWIANHLCPNEPLTDSLLNAAEKLKCRLSSETLKATEILEEAIEQTSLNKNQSLRLNRLQLEELLIKNGLLKSLTILLSQTLQKANANNYNLKDIYGAVLVGGGARIPLIRNWLKKHIYPVTLLTPPPVEAVVKGALSLTPNVTIRDILRDGVSLRCWDKKSQKHIWHPLFVAGQAWPTNKNLELILSASRENQLGIDLVIGETKSQNNFEVVYINGIPKIKEELTEATINAWVDRPVTFDLNPPGQPGEDCIQLNFSINTSRYLQVEGKDIRTGTKIPKKKLGLVN